LAQGQVSGTPKGIASFGQMVLSEGE